jgi:hypothetical protein
MPPARAPQAGQLPPVGEGVLAQPHECSPSSDSGAALMLPLRCGTSGR